MPFAFVRNGVMSAIYWSVGKEYQPSKTGAEGPRTGVLRGKIQVRSPNPVIGSVPRKNMKKNRRNLLKYIVQSVTGEKAINKPHSLQGQFGNKLTPEGRFDDGVKPDRPVEKKKRLSIRKSVGSVIKLPLHVAKRLWRRMDPLGDAATDLHNSGFTLHEGATLAIRGSDSAIDSEIDVKSDLTRNNNLVEGMEGNAVDEDTKKSRGSLAWSSDKDERKEKVFGAPRLESVLKLVTRDEMEKGTEVVAEVGAGMHSRPRNGNSAQQSLEPVEIDPTDVDSQKGLNLPWERFYNNNFDVDVNRSRPLDAVVEATKKSVGNAIGSLKLPRIRDKQQLNETQEILRQRDEILRLQAEVSRRRKEEEQAKLRERVSEVGDATAKVFPISAEVLRVIGEGVNAIGKYVPGVARTSQLVGWVRRKVKRRSVIYQDQRNESESALLSTATPAPTAGSGVAASIDTGLM